MRTHYVDVVAMQARNFEGFDRGICGAEFVNYHDPRAVPLPGQLRRFFDGEPESVDCKSCKKIFATRFG